MNTRLSPKDFFLQLGAIAALYVSAVSLLSLVFEIVYAKFPDVLNYYRDVYSSGMRASMAALFISFPILLILTWFINSIYEREPEKRESPFRKWIIYITLFVAGVTIAVDLIVLLNVFLGGDLTVRFVLDVLAVLIVAGMVFGYFLHDLKRSPDSRQIPRIFGGVALLFVVVAISAGFAIMGSPFTQRLIRLDNERVSSLQSIQWRITDYWQKKRELPNTLSDLNDPVSNFMVPKDPQTGTEYGYEKIGNTSFKLCADFAKESRTSNKVPTRVSVKDETNLWEHGVGKTCFDRKIDPGLYPPILRD